MTQVGISYGQESKSVGLQVKCGRVYMIGDRVAVCIATLLRLLGEGLGNGPSVEAELVGDRVAEVLQETDCV